MINHSIKNLYLHPLQEDVWMTTRSVVNGHLMVFVRMRPTLDTCLLPARNLVEFVTVVGQEFTKMTTCS